MIPSNQSHLHVAAITHPGMSGKNNEDNYAVTAHRISKTDSTSSLFAVLADGVGGHNAGEVAAEIAIETISHTVQESDASDPIEILRNAIVQASQKIADQSNSNLGHQGMGSTCACVWIIGDRVYTASVGDSRIYFIRDGVIQQVTTDHTWVQEAIEHGILEPDQARDHPRAHIIRRYLGSKITVEPDFRLRLNPNQNDEQALANQGFKLLAGDLFLICSDGLTDLVEDAEILETLKTTKMDSAIHSLVELANQRGGHDNITIVTLQKPVSEVPVKLKGQPAKLSKIKLSWQIYLAISIFVLLMVILGSVLYLYASRTRPNPSPTPTATVTANIQEILTVTQELPETPTLTPFPTETQIPATYTPWPTNTPLP